MTETPEEGYARRIRELEEQVAADPSDFNAAEGLRLLRKYEHVTVGDALAEAFGIK